MMISQAQSWQQDAEARFIERLQARFEDDGFTFTAHPEPAQLPDFLGSYLPDALAQKPGRNLVIEVIRRQGTSTEWPLRDIRRLFDGHDDWKFHVVHMGADPLDDMTIQASAPEAIRGHIDEVRTLLAEGHRRPAFLTAWSLLEAALRALADKTAGRPREPGQVIQTMGMNGFIEPDLERRLRDLVDLRNRVMHGDLLAEPSAADVELVLSAIDEAFAAAED